MNPDALAILAALRAQPAPAQQVRITPSPAPVQQDPAALRRVLMSVQSPTLAQQAATVAALRGATP